MKLKDAIGNFRFVDNWYSYSVNLDLAQILHEADGRRLEAKLWWSHSHSLIRKGAIFRDDIENYFSCSHLARRDRDYHMIILVFPDENEITYCCSHVSRRDRDL